MNFMGGHLRVMARLVVHSNHLPWHDLHCAHAQHVQCGIGHPGHEAQSLDLLRSFSRQRAVVRWHVIDRDHGQAVLVAALSQLGQQPVPVGHGHRTVGLLTRIPALVQRFRGHRPSEAMHLRQDFEAPVEDKACIRVGLLDVAHQRHQTIDLPLPRLGRFGHKLEGVEGVEKKVAKAFGPQGLDHFSQVEGPPRGR